MFWIEEETFSCRCRTATTYRLVTPEVADPPVTSHTTPAGRSRNRSRVSLTRLRAPQAHGRHLLGRPRRLRHQRQARDLIVRKHRMSNAQAHHLGRHSELRQYLKIGQHRARISLQVDSSSHHLFFPELIHPERWRSYQEASRPRRTDELKESWVMKL